jgi:non-ribosomal peptide synthetase component F
LPLSTMRLEHTQTPPADFAGGGTGASSLATIGQLLIEAAIQCPEADALIGNFGSMTYADLLIRAQNVALVLKRRGIGPGNFVGILMTQTPSAITAIAGITLTGAAYVPVHPHLLQAAASADSITQTGVSLLLWDSEVLSLTSIDLRRAAVPALDVSRIEQETMPSSTEIQLPMISMDEPAARFLQETPGYVTVSHRSIARLVSARIFNLGSGATFLLRPYILPSMQHPSLFELWGSLLQGASLVIAAADHREDSTSADWIARKGVSILCLGVARVQEAIDLTPTLFAGLHTLVIENDGRSGAVPPSRIEWLQREYPRLQIVIVYSTGSTAGYATAYRVPPQFKGQTELPIGLPLDGSQARIVDDQLEPLRKGEMGQLVLTGDCVALHSTGATQSPGMLLTGERACLRADGLLELHGHFEPQLVIDSRARAFENADIEAMLSGQKHVREAAVVNGVDRNGKSQIVAFIAMDQQDPTITGPFEESLKGLLPLAARPSAVRYVEVIPRDAQGAIDRSALQQRWKKESESATHADSPQQEILQFVRSLWLRLLRRNFIGYEEDFFAAGGTQVQMIRMHSELNRRFPGAISMAQLSVLSTMRNICEHLLDHAADARRSRLAQRGA